MGRIVEQAECSGFSVDKVEGVPWDGVCVTIRKNGVMGSVIVPGVWIRAANTPGDLLALADRELYSVVRDVKRIYKKEKRRRK